MRRLSRRRIIAMTGGASVLSLLACTAPAAPTATPAPAKPVAEPTKPAAAPTTAPAAAATTAPAAAPTTAPAATKPAAAATAAPAATKPAAAAQPAAPAKAGGRITEGTFADAQILNPILSTDTASGRINGLLYNSVITVEPPKGEPKGELAEKWTTSEDGLVYTFTLRKGVKFHDGKELTAEDVKYTYDRILDPEINSPRRSTVAGAIAGPEAITVKDPYTIEFKLKQPYAPFLVQVMIYGILPKHVLQDKKGKDFNSADFNTKSPMGSGPFKFKEWVKDNHIVLDANKDYFKGAPKLDQYIYKVVKDATVVAAQLKTGEMDFGAFEPALLAEMEKVQSLNIKRYDNFSFTFYSYQLDKAKSDLFQDKLVRQALFTALDRKAMLESIMFGQGAVADSVFPLLSWAYDPKENPKYEYNPNKAKQLLDEAGWKPGADGVREKGGKKLAFTIYTNAGNKVRESFITVMQEQWKEIGVAATPKTEEWNAFLNRITKTKDFEVFLVGFNWGVDPDESSMWSTEGQNGGFNMNTYANPKVDQLLKDALKETSTEKRKALYKEVDKTVLDELPSPILVFAKTLAAVNKRVVNLEPNAFNTTYNVEQWAVTDGR